MVSEKKRGKKNKHIHVFSTVDTVVRFSKNQNRIPSRYTNNQTLVWFSREEKKRYKNKTIPSVTARRDLNTERSHKIHYLLCVS